MNAPPKTVLFTDVVGSTEFASVRGDEMAVALLRVHEEIARDAASNHDGLVVKSTGDGFLLIFSSSVSGVAAALEIRDRLEQYNVAHPDAALPVRIGLNAGPVIEEVGDFYGMTVNAAARVAAKARSGQVLVSESVRAEASSSTGWTFVDRGLFWLKGLREQWRLHEATRGEVAVQPSALEGRTPFVDRDEERAALRRYVDRANDGRGALVVVAGSAGVGKTRLVEEIGTEAQARGLEFLIGRCHETSRGEPYAPLVEVLEAVQRRLTPERFRELVGEYAGEIARLLPNLRRSYSDIPPPAEVPSNEERRYLFVSVQEVLARLAAVRPVVMLVDDVHWADGPSLLLLEHIAGTCRASDPPRRDVHARGGLHRRPPAYDAHEAPPAPSRRDDRCR
jgi:class 3 adenylate cyclase